ncbi:hypothetical protein [Thermus albus]|uniref:hypothetical protein n=1 Tax=Thermus albus TaxID=2908146 RepID=UPI001FAA78C1|nr:hypothetical protein [Thermus albus]
MTETRDAVVVFRHWSGRVDILGGKALLVDEKDLLSQGAALYYLYYGDGRYEVYEEAFLATLALWYASQTDSGAYLEVVDRNGYTIAVIGL